MKIRVAVGFVLLLFLSCDSLNEDPSPEFPECAGIKGSFDPRRIASSYSGKIGNDDTVIHTSFTFTDYVDYNYLLSAQRSWNMWIRFTSSDTIKYQSSYCYYSFTDQRWYASTGFDLAGRYGWWEFQFQTFTCSRLSGSLEVAWNNDPDPEVFYFEANR